SRRDASRSQGAQETGSIHRQARGGETIRSRSRFLSYLSLAPWTLFLCSLFPGRTLLNQGRSSPFCFFRITWKYRPLIRLFCYGQANAKKIAWKAASASRKGRDACPNGLA